MPSSAQQKNGSGRCNVQKENILVATAVKGDLGAFHQLVKQYRGSIYRMVYYRIRSKMDAEDLTQEIFLAAYQHLAGLKDPQVFKSWLYRIALNRVRDFIRKKKFLSFFSFSKNERDVEHLPHPPTAAEAEISLERKIFWKKVETILEKMSKMEREVFVLRFFDQMGIAQMARLLEKGESTIKTHLYRAIKKFRKDPTAKALMEEMIP